MQYHTYIDGSISAGASTIAGISTQGYEYGVGISSDFQVSGITTLGITSVSSLHSSGSISAESLFISGTTTLGIISLSSLNLSGSISAESSNISGIVTANGGFISIANTTPITISLLGNKLTFSAAGIGSTSFLLF